MLAYSEKKYRSKISFKQDNNSLLTLIAICLVLFVGLAFLKAVWYSRFPKEEALGYFNQQVLSWFVLPATTGELIRKPWTIITHMFVHDDFWRILSNMLWLWCFGFIMQDITGNRKLIPVFIYGSLGGAIGFILAYNLIPSLAALANNAVLIGSSAGVMAVAVVITIISPRYRIFPMIAGGIPLWVLTAVFIIADLATVSIYDTGGLIAHISGGVTGFLFMWLLRRGYDMSDWMNNFFDWVNNLFNPDKPSRKSKPIKEQLFYKTDDKPYTITPKVTQKRVGDILDRISRDGYQFLTDEEKEFLKRAGETDL